MSGLKGGLTIALGDLRYQTKAGPQILGVQEFATATNAHLGTISASGPAYVRLMGNASGASISLPVPVAGQQVTIHNASSQAVLLYPNDGYTLGGVVAVSLPAGARRVLVAYPAASVWDSDVADPVAYDAETAAWMSAVSAGGGAYTAAQAAALTRWGGQARASGYHPMVRRFNPFAGQDLAACLVPLVKVVGGATDTNVNFISGDYAPTTGLAGNGTNKYLDTGYQPSEATGGMGFYLLGTPMADSVFMGCRNTAGTQAYRLRRTGIPTREALWGGATTASLAGGVTAPALLMAQRTSATALAVFQNGSQIVNEPTSTTPGAAGANMFVFCQNSNGTPVLFYAGASAGYMVVSGAMSASHIEGCYAHWRTLALAFGRSA